MFVKILFVFVFCSLGFSAKAQSSFENSSVGEISTPADVSPKKRSWKLLLAAGHLNELQKSVQGDSYEPKGQMMFSYGVQLKKYQYALMFSRSEQSSRTGNFSIGSRRRTHQVSWHYLPRSWGSWSPMIGAGIGTYKDSVNTQFGSEADVSNGDWLLLGAVSGGVQFRFFRMMYSDLLVKAVKRESSKEFEWASQATLGFQL